MISIYNKWYLVYFISILFLFSQLVLDCYVLLFDSVLSRQHWFKLIYEISLDQNLFSCVFAWQILYVCTACEFELQQMSKSMNLFDKFFRLNVQRWKRLYANNFSDIFIHDFISNQLYPFEDSLSIWYQIYLNLFRPCYLSIIL